MSEPAIIYDFDPRNLPPELLQAIGLVTAAASQTESIVQDFIGALLRLDMIESKALTLHMSGPLKDNIARSLAELKAPHSGEVDEVDDLLDAINDASDLRNTIVHNSFARHPETGQVFSYRLRARGSLQGSLSPVSVEEFEEHAATIYEVGMDLMRFMMSRGLTLRDRDVPLRAPLDRRKKARTRRRESTAGDGTA